MYHRVADPVQDAYGLSVAPDRFASHVEHLRRLNCVVPLTEILRPTTSLQVAITFDDGYADNATQAAPLLVEAGLPATYFITSGRLGGQHFWWDRLAAGVLRPPAGRTGIDVTVDGRDLWLALDDEGACRASLRFLHRRLRPLPPDELLATVAEVLQTLQAPEPPVDASSMTVDQLVALSRLPLVEIGAHTRTHLQLGGQTPALQRSEVIGSLMDLSGLLGKSVTSFAYPFGSELAIGDLAPRLAREAGCVLACSTERAPVTPSSDPHRLPRLNVENWDVSEFAAQLQSLAGGGQARSHGVRRRWKGRL